MRRVAVVVDGPGTPAWQAEALERLRGSSSAEVVEVRVVASGGAPAWRRHRAFERRFFGLGPDALAVRAVETEAPAGGADVVVWLSDAPAPNGDNVLRVGHGPFLEAAGPAFRRAVASGAATVVTEVRAGDRVVASSVSGVRPFSATLSGDAALWKTAGLVVRAAERYAAPHPAAAAPPAPAATPDAAATPPAAAPPAAAPLENAAAPPETAAPPPASAAAPASAAPRAPRAGFAVRSAARWGRVLGTRLLYRRPWRISLRERGPDPAGGWAEPGPALVEWEPGHVYADPFLFEHAGRHHLFCEAIPPGANRGVIAHVELGEDRPAGPPVPVMKADHHLSYPFVFEHEGELFLLPESSAARRLELHRAVEFPLRWALDTVLFEELDVVDATPFEHEGRLWMFAAIAARGASRLEELHLFLSEGGPRGPWTPHPLNPVLSDVRAGRPAGAVLREDGRLIRPAQDGSRRYGWAVSFRAIDVLNETQYAEREVARIEPSAVRGARAVHAYTRDSRYEAIDLRVRELRRRPPGATSS